MVMYMTMLMCLVCCGRVSIETCYSQYIHNTHTAAAHITYMNNPHRAYMNHLVVYRALHGPQMFSFVHNGKVIIFSFVNLEKCLEHFLFKYTF